MNLIAAGGIAGAAASAVSAGVAAGADVTTNAIQAGTTAYMNDANNRLSLQLSGISSQTQLALAGLQATVSLFDNNQKTVRLGMNLAALAAAQSQNLAFQVMAMKNDYALKFATLAMQARTQAYQFQSQLAQAKSGAVVPQDSNGTMQVSSYGMVTGASLQPGGFAAALAPAPLRTTATAATRLLGNLQAPQPPRVARAIASTPVSRVIAPRAFNESRLGLVRHTPRTASPVFAEAETASVDAGHHHGH